MSRKARRGPKRSYTVFIVIALVLVLAVVAYYIFTSSGIVSSSPLVGTAVPSTVLNDLNVSTATLSTVGSGTSGVTSPISTTSSTTAVPSPLTSNGKPEVLYMGAEYCPFCAAERWALIVALDKFGTFSGLEYMQSGSSPEAYPNTSTFTFVHATYTSSYISFVAVESEDRSDAPLMTPTANETALSTKYDSQGSIPFIDYANQYVQIGSQYTPPILRVGQSPTGAPDNWTQIASQLNTPSSLFALNIDGAANRIISTICKIDNGAPTSVCSQSFASTLSYAKSSPSSGSQLAISDAVLTGPPSSAASERFATTRLIALD